MTLGYGEAPYRQATKVVLHNPARGGRQHPFVLAVVLFALSSAAPGVAKAQKAPGAPAPAANSGISDGSKTTPLPSPAVQAIPLPQIADQAKELHNHMLEIYQELNSTQQTLPSESATQARAVEIRERTLVVDALIKSIPTSLDLRVEDQYWVTLNQKFTSQRKLLTSRATSLGNQLQRLEVQQAVWQATFDQIRQTLGITAVVDRVQQELNSIKATRTRVQEQLNLVLTLQNQISQQEQLIGEVLNQLSQAREQLRGHLFARDGHALWERNIEKNKKK